MTGVHGIGASLRSWCWRCWMERLALEYDRKPGVCVCACVRVANRHVLVVLQRWKRLLSWVGAAWHCSMCFFVARALQRCSRGLL